MDVLDDKGRLFGVVNVVDALVVLFVLALALASTALLVGGADGPSQGTSEEPTNYALIGYSVTDSPGATVVGVNETIRPVEGGDNFTVQETAYSFTQDGRISVIATVSYDGIPDVGSRSADVGTEVAARMNESTRTVEFLAVNRSSADIDIRTKRVVLAVSEGAGISHAVESGTDATIGGRTVATVESITPTSSARNRTEFVGLELRVWANGGKAWFGGQAVRVNNRLTVLTDEAVISGTIYRIDTSDTTELVSQRNGS